MKKALLALIAILLFGCVSVRGESTISFPELTLRRVIFPAIAKEGQEVLVKYEIINTGAYDVSDVSLHENKDLTEESIELGYIASGQTIGCELKAIMGDRNLVSEGRILYTGVADKKRYSQKLDTFIIWCSNMYTEAVRETEKALKRNGAFYVERSVSKLGISFEAPSTWLTENSLSDTYVMGNPETTDSFVPIIEIQVKKQNKKLTSSDLQKRVKSFLKEYEQFLTFVEYKTSNVAKRQFVNTDGIYGAYKGVLEDGTRIGGGVIMSCDNNFIYMLHVS